MACQPSTKPVTLNIPHNLTQDCPPLATVVEGDGAYMLKAWIADRRQYVECAQGKHALIKAVKPSE